MMTFLLAEDDEDDAGAHKRHSHVVHNQEIRELHYRPPFLLMRIRQSFIHAMPMSATMSATFSIT
jgi:hypothetical protein